MVTPIWAFACFATAFADLDGLIPGDEKRYISRYAATEKSAINNSPPKSQSGIPSEPPQLSSAAVAASPGTAAVSAPMGVAAVAYDATQCKTLEELETWRHQVGDHIQKFVPKQYQEFAGSRIESKYQKRKAELQAAENTSGNSVVAGVSPDVLAATGGDLRHMLAEVVNCNSREELEAWRWRVREFVDKALPQQFKPFALADMQRHFEIRLADLRRTSSVPEAQVLKQMLADVDLCTSEPELVIWRENVASHIRSQLPPRFQIPALADMQMRFDRRLEIIQDAASNPEIEASPTAKSSRIEETATHVAGFGTFTVVLGGLVLPAFIAVFAGFVRARQKGLATPIRGAETGLLQV